MGEDVDRGEGLAVAALAENFGQRCSEALLGMWLEMLEPYPAAVVKAAARRVMETYAYKTMPPFAVLKRELDGLSGTGEKALEIRALAEWSLLLAELERKGRYGAPRLGETTLYVVRLLGGWEAACNWELASLDFKRRDFIRLWMDACGRVELMRLGENGVLEELRRKTGGDSGLVRVGEMVKAGIGGK